MKAIERLKFTNPNELNSLYIGGAFSCPTTYYKDSIKYCSFYQAPADENCEKCWEQNLPPRKVKVYNKKTGEILQCSKKH